MQQKATDIKKTLEHAIQSPSIPQRVPQSIRRNLSFAIGSPAIIWQVLFFYLPLFFMIATSFVDTTSWSFTLKHYFPAAKIAYLSTIYNSLSLAFATAIICLFMGFPLAYFIAFNVKKRKNFFLFLLIVPFWTNFLLHIYAWFFVLERNGFLNQILLAMHIISEPLHLLNSYFATLLMMVYYYLPFMVLPIYFSLERFNVNYLEASLDLGANPAQTFRNILLPLSMNAIRGGFLLVFVPAFGEFIIPELMGGDKNYFVGSVISLFVLGETTVPVGTAFTMLSTLALILAAGGVYFLFSTANRFLLRRVSYEV